MTGASVKTLPNNGMKGFQNWHLKRKRSWCAYYAGIQNTKLLPLNEKSKYSFLRRKIVLDQISQARRAKRINEINTYFKRLCNKRKLNAY